MQRSCRVCNWIQESEELEKNAIPLGNVSKHKMRVVIAIPMLIVSERMKDRIYPNKAELTRSSHVGCNNNRRTEAFVFMFTAVISALTAQGLDQERESMGRTK